MLRISKNRIKKRSHAHTHIRPFNLSQVHEIILSCKSYLPKPLLSSILSQMLKNVNKLLKKNFKEHKEVHTEQ